MEFHPLSNLFPLMQGESFEALKRDISENGQREPIVMLDGHILDGRNRWRACEELSIVPSWVKWKKGRHSDTPLAFVLSMNVDRRHMGTTPRAMCAARLVPVYQAQVKPGRPKKIPPNLGELPQGEATHRAAQRLNVSHGIVETAVVVLREGAPELIAACDADLIAVDDALGIVEESVEIQNKLLTDVLEGKAATLRRARRTLRDARLRENPPRDVSLEGPFDLVLADPPWRYEFQETHAREIEVHYPTVELEEIAAHKPSVTDNALLLLWATAPKLREALEIVEAWGFTYRSHAVWDKQKIGTGYWFRGQHEILIVAIRGEFSPPSEFARHSSVFSEARREHSRKPDCVYEWIELAFPHAAKLEMYARQPREGWIGWGYEASRESGARESVSG